jgi:hypothetical protein
MREARLGLGGPRDNNAHSPLRRLGNPGLPDGGLANPRFALKDDSGATPRGKSLVEHLQLGLAAHKLMHDGRS